MLVNNDVKRMQASVRYKEYALSKTHIRNEPRGNEYCMKLYEINISWLIDWLNDLFQWQKKVWITFNNVVFNSKSLGGNIIFLKEWKIRR